MPRGVPKNGFRRTQKRIALEQTLKVRTPIKVESVEEIESKLSDRFEALEIMAEATGKGINRSLIVSGPAGLGKSYTVEQKMTELEAKGKHVVYIKGYIHPLTLYK